MPVEQLIVQLAPLVHRQFPPEQSSLQVLLVVHSELQAAPPQLIVQVQPEPAQWHWPSGHICVAAGHIEPLDAVAEVAPLLAEAGAAVPLPDAAPAPAALFDVPLVPLVACPLADPLFAAPPDPVNSIFWSPLASSQPASAATATDMSRHVRVPMARAYPSIVGANQTAIGAGRSPTNRENQNDPASPSQPGPRITRTPAACSTRAGRPRNSPTTPSTQPAPPTASDTVDTRDTVSALS